MSKKKQSPSQELLNLVELQRELESQSIPDGDTFLDPNTEVYSLGDLFALVRVSLGDETHEAFIAYVIESKPMPPACQVMVRNFLQPRKDYVSQEIYSELAKQP
jgi:hypothetical protein